MNNENERGGYRLDSCCGFLFIVFRFLMVIRLVFGFAFIIVGAFLSFASQTIKRLALTFFMIGIV